MAAMALFHDDLGRVLLVNPTYMDEWLLPGGSVEADESPHAACRREVVEETGLDRAPGRIVAVDWVPTQSDWPEGLLVIYDGGVLTSADIEDIVVDGEEISEFRFVAPDQVGLLVSARSGRRIAACLKALRSGEVLSLEDGRPAV
jgi:8-oxo-dGTP pyrophosphatase MutT (NUDIX family)